MNKKPISFLQIDERWKAQRVKAKGGTLSIGGGGCGPTCAAMLISTLAGVTVTPPEAMQWASEHGYLFAGQGTAYEYFTPQLEAHGIECRMLTWTPCLNSSSSVRRQVERMLGEGYYFVALMKTGLWTSNGHFVLVWAMDDRVRILDPASTADARVNGDPDTFFSQAKYFWWVDARAHNNAPGVDAVDRWIADLTPEQAYKILVKAQDYLRALPLPTSWPSAEQLAEAKTLGITDGTRPMDLCTRLEASVMAARAAFKG